MRTLTCLLLLAGLAICASPDVSVTGTWSGTFHITAPDGETKDTGALLVLKQEGSMITGTVGPDEGERITIKKGTIEGNKITLECSDEEHNRSIRFDLAIEGERIKGEANFSNAEGEKRNAKLDVGRVK
jgi:hypothetical protein